VSSPKNIHREWRLICSGTEVITGSRYKTHGLVDFNSEVPEEIISYAEYILKKTSWRPDPVFVMDMCLTKESAIRILEIGAFSVAGLYRCDLGRIVERVSQIASREWSEYQP